MESYASSSKKDNLQPACTTKSKATISKDSDNLFKELKKSTNIKDINHVKVLLSETFNTRRQWIKDLGNSCSVILDEYPVLKNTDLVSIISTYNFLNSY